MYPYDPPNAALVAAVKRAVHAPAMSITVSWDGVTWTDESAYILALRGVESVDPTSRYPQAAEVTIELDNSTRRYSADNAASPLYPYLTHGGQKVRIDLGYDGLTERVGTYWIEDLAPNETAGTAAVRLFDRLGSLVEARARLTPTLDARTDELAALLLGSVSVPATDYVLDVGERRVPFAISADQPALAELAQLAQAEGGRLFADPEGVIRLWNRSRHLDALRLPKIGLTRSAHLYDMSYPRRTDSTITRYVLEFDTRENVTVDEVVYVQTGPVVVGPATVRTIDSTPYAFFAAPLTLQVQAMDRVRWERYLPVEFTTIASLVAREGADGSGPVMTVVAGEPPQSGTIAPSPTLYYAWEPAGAVGMLKLWSALGTKCALTALTINGKPKRAVSPYAVVATDPAADLYGLVTAEQKNAYLPGTDVAQEIATEELLTRGALVRTVTIRATDGLPFLHPRDAFTVEDDRTGATLYLQVLSHEWSYSPTEGYTSSLTTAPALPPTEEALTIAFVPPTGLPAVDVANSGKQAPFGWGDPYHAADVVAPSTFPWQSAGIAGGYVNAAPISAAADDAPIGNPTPDSLRFAFNGAASDQMAHLPLPAPVVPGTTYTVRFWARLASGSGSIQWIVGSKSVTTNRSSSGGQVLTGAWVQKTIAWTPSSAYADPVLAIASWGAITADVRIAGVTVTTGGAPATQLIWTYGDWG